MSAKRCRYGKLKHPSKGRRCKRKPYRPHKGGRTGSRRGRGRRAGKIGGGLLVLGALGAGAVWLYTQNNGSTTPPAQ